MLATFATPLNSRRVRQYLSALKEYGFEIPAEITTLADAFNRLQNATTPNPPMAPSEAQIITQLHSAANPVALALELAAPQIDYDRALQLSKYADTLLQAAADRALLDLNSLMEQAYGAEFVQQDLAADLQELLAEAAELVERQPTIAAGPDAVLSGGAPARKAWDRLGALHEQYRALRTMQAHAGKLEDSDEVFDQSDVFAEIRNLPALLPNWQDLRSNERDPAPHTSTDRQRLAWLITSHAEVWMPTVAERRAELNAALRGNAKTVELPRERRGRSRNVLIDPVTPDNVA